MAKKLTLTEEDILTTTLGRRSFLGKVGGLIAATTILGTSTGCPPAAEEDPEADTTDIGADVTDGDTTDTADVTDTDTGADETDTDTTDEAADDTDAAADEAADDTDTTDTGDEAADTTDAAADATDTD